MNKFITTVLLILFVVLTQANEPPELNIQLQKDAQEQCVVLRTNACISVCQKTNAKNCTQLCSENAKNECRQAGE